MLARDDRERRKRRAFRSRSRRSPPARSRTRRTSPRASATRTCRQQLASAATTVDPVADLSITKTDSPDPVSSGQQLTYTLDVDNSGPSSATGVSVTDTLPSGVTYESATPSQGSCSHVGRHRHLRARDRRERRQRQRRRSRSSPTPGGSITNQASVTATTADPVLVNNAASATTTVDPVADLSLTKADSPDPVLSGQQLTYTLAVHNAGPASAPSVSLSDALPSGVDLRVRHPHPGQLRAPRQHRHVRARHDRERRQRHRRDQGRRGRSRRRSPMRRPCCQRPPTRTRPTTPPARSTTIKPVADLGPDEVRFPRPGAGRPAAHLHPRGVQRRPARRRRCDGHRRPAVQLDLRFGQRLPGQLHRVRRHGHVCARHRRQRRDGERPDQGPAEQPGHRHEPGKRRVGRRRPEPVEQLRRRA